MMKRKTKTEKLTDWDILAIEIALRNFKPDLSWTPIAAKQLDELRWKIQQAFRITLTQ